MGGTHRLVSGTVFAIALAAQGAAADDALLVPFGSVGAVPQAPWHVAGLPEQTKPFTQFSIVEAEGRPALRIEADRSYGNLVHPLKSLSVPAHLAWRWRVEQPLKNADLREKSGDDSAVKVCVFFDEALDRLSFGERQLLRFARARSAEPVPVATVCYVWDLELPADTAIDNAFTRRLRYIVLESGTTRLGQWLPERRDLGADFLRLFGAESASVPPIVGIAVGADADNTQGHSIAYVSDLMLEP